MININKWLIGLLLMVVCVEGLKCPYCTYMTTTADVNAFVKSTVDSFLGLFQKTECAQPVTGPSALNEENCSPDTGMIARCSSYEGDLKLSLIGIELPVKIHQKGCYYTPEAAPLGVGCHNRDGVGEDRTFLKSILSKTSSLLSDVVSFRGTLCLCSDTYCQTSGVSQGGVMYMLLFAIQLLFVIFYLF